MEIKKRAISRCPICGGRAEIRHGVRNGMETYSEVHCTMCDAKTSKIKVSASICADDEAVKLWNDSSTRLRKIILAGDRIIKAAEIAGEIDEDAIWEKVVEGIMDSI